MGDGRAQSATTQPRQDAAHPKDHDGSGGRVWCLTFMHLLNAQQVNQDRMNAFGANLMSLIFLNLGGGEDLGR